MRISLLFSTWYQSFTVTKEDRLEMRRIRLGGKIVEEAEIRGSAMESKDQCSLELSYASNFLIWKNQIHNMLRATGLIGYVDGSIPCPPAQIKDSSGSEISNPTRVQWDLIDAHLLSCLTATLSSPIYSTVVQFKHCYEVWNALIKRFTILSRSHIHQLKNKLNAVSKKGASMEEYLTQIKNLSNQLALASAVVDDEDLVLITLNGLPDEYDSFKTAIRARSEGISMDELCALLCSESIHVEFKTQKSSLIEQPNVAFSAARGFRSNQTGSSRGSQGRFFSKGGRGGQFSQQSRGRFFTQRHSRGRFSPRGRGRSGPVCQICGIFGHIAFDCWHRLDAQYQPPGQSSSQSVMSSSKAFVSSSSHPTPSISSSSSMPWYLDSAATDHMTNDLNNFDLYQDYPGTDRITVGNGQSVPIHHTGQGQANEENSSPRFSH
ncbi:hypothetical protein CsSME_00052291 [Camellia sinensis var. sinensis]